MEFDSVIYDLDGTLLDTAPGIIESVKYTINLLGFTPMTDKEMHAFIGPPLSESFQKYCGCNLKEADRAVAIFRDFYQKEALLNAIPYDGIYECFQLLSEAGFRMSVATNKPERFALRLMNHFRFDRYLRAIHGADEDGKLRKADLIRLCIRETGGTTSTSVVVGDTVSDAKGARETGVSFLAVSYGFGFRTNEDLKELSCIGIADSPRQIAAILLNKT